MTEKTIPLKKAREAVDQSVLITGRLFYSVAQELVETLGEEKGIELLRRAMHRFGAMRGKAIRERTDALGLPPTVATLKQYYDSPLSVSQDADVIRSEENYLEKKARTCGTGRALKALGPDAVRFGPYWCEQDRWLREAFNDRFEYTQLTNMLLGDDCCHSILKLRE